jgi:hypothetical protein
LDESIITLRRVVVSFLEPGLLHPYIPTPTSRNMYYPTLSAFPDLVPISHRTPLKTTS